MLCPVPGGALKPTTNGKWAHVACTHWVPEAVFVNPAAMEPIGAHYPKIKGLRNILSKGKVGQRISAKCGGWTEHFDGVIDSINVSKNKSMHPTYNVTFDDGECKKNIKMISEPKSSILYIEQWRFDEICQVCDCNKTGAVVKCKHRGCNNLFHPLCGRGNGYYMEFEFDEKKNKVTLTCLCETHTLSDRTNEFTGRDIGVWLPTEQVWAIARVGLYNPKTKLNKLAYHADGSVEWIRVRELIASYRRTNGGGWNSSNGALPPPPIDVNVVAAALMPTIRVVPPERTLGIVEYVPPSSTAAMKTTSTTNDDDGEGGGEDAYVSSTLMDLVEEEEQREIDVSGMGGPNEETFDFDQDDSHHVEDAIENTFGIDEMDDSSLLTEFDGELFNGMGGEVDELGLGLDAIIEEDENHLRKLNSLGLPDIQIGYHVSIYWLLDKQWYNAVVIQIGKKNKTNEDDDDEDEDDRKGSEGSMHYQVKYDDDGVTEWLDFSQERVTVLDEGDNSNSKKKRKRDDEEEEEEQEKDQSLQKQKRKKGNGNAHQATASSISSYAYVSGSVYGKSFPLNVLGEWRCGQCLYTNPFKRKQCKICFLSKKYNMKERKSISSFGLRTHFNNTFCCPVMEPSSKNHKNNHKKNHKKNQNTKDEGSNNMLQPTKEWFVQQKKFKQQQSNQHKTQHNIQHMQRNTQRRGQMNTQRDMQMNGQRNGSRDMQRRESHEEREARQQHNLFLNLSTSTSSTSILKRNPSYPTNNSNNNNSNNNNNNHNINMNNMNNRNSNNNSHSNMNTSSNISNRSSTSTGSHRPISSSLPSSVIGDVKIPTHLIAVNGSIHEKLKSQTAIPLTKLSRKNNTSKSMEEKLLYDKALAMAASVQAQTLALRNSKPPIQYKTVPKTKILVPHVCSGVKAKQPPCSLASKNRFLRSVPETQGTYRHNGQHVQGALRRKLLWLILGEKYVYMNGLISKNKQDREMQVLLIAMAGSLNDEEIYFQKYSNNLNQYKKSMMKYLKGLRCEIASKMNHTEVRNHEHDDPYADVQIHLRDDRLETRVALSILFKKFNVKNQNLSSQSRGNKFDQVRKSVNGDFLDGLNELLMDGKFS